MKLGNKTILLVDDDSLVARSYERRLTAAGAQVILAANGAEGLAQLQIEKPDIILLDLMMPKMNGYEMLKEIKSNPETKDIPVIILTNLNDRPKDVEKVKELGVKEYLIKTDTSLTEMVEQIASYLNTDN